MYCSWCGKTERWRCAECGKYAPTTWLALMGVITWATLLGGSSLYLWRLLPTIAAIMAGLGHELEPVTQWHVMVFNALFIPVVALLGAFGWWIRRAGPSATRAIAGFALTGSLGLAFTLAASYGALFSIAMYFPPVIRLQITANELTTIDDLRRVVKAGAPITCETPSPDFLATAHGYARGCSSGFYWATPLESNRTGARGFAADSAGRICFTRDGSIPKMAGNCDLLP